MKSSRENEVNRGKEVNFLREGKASNNCCGKWKRELILGRAGGLARSTQGPAEVLTGQKGCVIFLSLASQSGGKGESRYLLGVGSEIGRKAKG